MDAVKEHKEDKKKLLVWSGGMDSTSILLDCVRHKIPIETLYIELKNNERKVKIEKHRRDIIKSIINDTYNINITDTTVVIGEVKPANSTIVSLWQPVLWLHGIIASITTDANYESIIFGYIRGDDFWHIRTKFESAYKNMWGIMVPDRQHEFIMPNLEFPIEWYTKEGVVDFYLADSFGREVFKYVWTCEYPSSDEFNECGTCLPCVHIKPAREHFDKVVSERFNKSPREVPPIIDDEIKKNIAEIAECLDLEKEKQ